MNANEIRDPFEWALAAAAEDARDAAAAPAPDWDNSGMSAENR